MKKIRIAIVVILLMLFSLLLTANAETQRGTCGVNLTWTLTDDDILSISGTGEMFDYSIISNSTTAPWGSAPKQVIISDNVTSIGNYAFSYCVSMSNISIPDSLKNIGENAFYFCGSLSSIELPNDMISIGGGAFAFSGLTSISIPNDIEMIAGSTFLDCHGLTSVSIPNSVASIQAEAFYHCENLLDIALPESVNSIGTVAFLGSGLRTIVMTNSVTEIQTNAFDECSNLTDVYYAGTAEEWNATKATAIASGGNDPLVNANVHFINAWNKCGEHVYWSLEEVSVPYYLFHREKENRLTIWGSGGMYNYGLEDSPFFNHLGIDRVIINEGVTSIGNYAFSGCSLYDIYFPEGLLNIGNYAFFSCEHLGQSPIIIYGGSNANSVEFPSSLGFIGDHAFEGCRSLTKISLSNNTYHLGKYMFKDCTSLSSVIIEQSGQNISEGMFYGCSSLRSITLPHGSSVGEKAFYQCTHLTVITVPYYIKAIGVSAFFGCENFQSVFCHGNVEWWPRVIIGAGNDILKNADVYYIDLPETYIFAKQTGLLGTMHGTTNVTTSPINYKGTIVRIQSAIDSFYEAVSVDGKHGYVAIDSFQLLTPNDLQIHRLTLPVNLTEIEEEAFSGLTSIRAVYFTNIQSIAENAFNGVEAIFYAPSSCQVAKEWADTHDLWFVPLD